LAEHLIEETAELLETIDRMDMNHMREELGDVLLQVVFHAQLASEKGLFDLSDVAAEINEKLIRRHPHVFGDHEKLNDSDSVLKTWEAVKATEKKNGPKVESKLKPLPKALPALHSAAKVYKMLKKQGYLDTAGLGESYRGVAEDASPEAIGKALFDLSAAARESGIDPEAALRQYTQQLIDRVEHA
jgi:XTP/dITP diphosphohydrolase/tetrapyrrole methylase family protein/MazG family protein